MVFTCSVCGARYRIDDERIRGKSLRVSCKKCSQRHRIRDEGNDSFRVEILPAEEASDSRELSDLGRPTRSLPTDGSPGTPSAPVPRREPLGETATGEPPPLPPRAPQNETWYALRKGVRLGPFDRPGLLRELQQGTILPDSFVWRPTMSSWQRLSAIPDLAEVLAEFQQRPGRPSPVPAAAPSIPQPPPPPSRTAVPALPVEPQGVSPGTGKQEETPPPLPPSTRDARRAPTPPATPAAPAAPGHLADDLFLDLSRPTIDLRKALEIQPEEPEQRPRDRSRKGAAPHAPTPHAPRPTLVAPVSPSREASSSDEMPLFPDAMHLPDPETKEIAHLSPGSPISASSLDPQLGVRDFSVMVRHMDRRGRRRNLTIAASLAGVLILACAGIVTWIWLSGPKGGALPIEEASSVEPRYESPSSPSSRPRELPRIPLLESPEEGARRPGTERPRSSMAPGETASASPPSAPTRAPSPPPLPKTIDEEVQQNTQRYGTLLAQADRSRAEQTPMEETPKTLDRMGSTRMNQQLMNEFLEKKYRRFEACKSRMQKPMEGQIMLGISFEVDTAGQVQNVQVVPKSGIWDGPLTRCVREVILEWAFPPQSERLYYQTNLML